MVRGVDVLCDESFCDLRARREPKADHMDGAPDCGVWCWYNQREQYRALGWWCEEEEPCEACELYPWGIEHYEIDDTGLCGACAARGEDE